MMELITLLGVACLILILVSAISKSAAAKRLNFAIEKTKKSIEESEHAQTGQLLADLAHEFDIIESALGRIETKAILDYPVIEEFVRSMPSECYHACGEKRRQLVADAMIKRWASERLGSLPQPIPWNEPPDILRRYIIDIGILLTGKPESIRRTKNLSPVARYIGRIEVFRGADIAQEASEFESKATCHGALYREEPFTEERQTEPIEWRQVNDLPTMTSDLNVKSGFQAVGV